MMAKLLDKINYPADMKKLSVNDLKKLAKEIRKYIITTIEKTGGHLASTLGAIELTVALHYIYNTPEDKLIWDVGHQSYAHKILTGRKDKLNTIRQYGGLCGFLAPSESEYDTFGAGHASTSISAAYGIASARDHKKEQYKVVAIIGDGAMTGGLAFEGLINAGSSRKQLLVILNDNTMSISPNVGAMRSYLTKVVTNPLYNRVRDEIWKTTGSLPTGKGITRKIIRKVEESLKSLMVPGLLFDEFGFRYFGPIDGNDMNIMVNTLENIKDINSPVLLHIVTKKGKGMHLAESDPVSFHGVAPNNGKEKKTAKEKVEVPSFQNAFGEVVCEIGRNREDTVCITAAMKEGTGLVPFATEFPDRFYDVGIAEGHAVTFAAGMAMQKMRPIVAIYSTFLQRAYDHIIHDVALQNLPVIFCMDRAGLVGEDGATHHGALDIAYLRCVPNLIVSAPKNGNELRNLMYTALNQTKNPFMIRYPRSSSFNFDDKGQAELLPIGSWEKVLTGKNVAILAVGSMVKPSLEVAIDLAKDKISCEVINCRFIQPMDKKYLKSVIKKFNKIITIEEGVINGGFGSGVSDWLTNNSYSGNIKRIGIPNKFITHGNRDLLLKEISLDKSGIIKEIKEFLNNDIK
ncbi:MAG: 1-deoxy-D-xylulose-5-phosphate synthase [Candidatus Marinimicrobia bacterium]|nr:1-deoxy-D-xylulose-5-phosphate synthase [Candidatus Neomarinimicrobiota bacterium]